jgi:hypothetical protein
MGQMYRLSTRFTWAESKYVGKSSFVEAMSTRKDSVFEKVIQELTCLENVYSTDVKIVYHPSCTIKNNNMLVWFTNVQQKKPHTRVLRLIWKYGVPYIAPLIF